MEKIKFITDTACDIPVEEAQKLGVDVAPLTVTVNGKTYRESYDITPEEFYRMCRDCKELPISAGVNYTEYYTRYEAAWKEGYTALCVVCINARGSVSYTAACHARDDFFAENPQAKASLRFEIVDSRTYSIAYGIPVMKAAEMAANGVALDDILGYFDDWFDRVEIYFCPLSFDFVKRSGRVSKTIAFVGEALGIRPVIYIIEGKTGATAKPRGDGKVVEAMVKIAADRAKKGTDYGILVGTPREMAEDLRVRLAATLGRPAAVLESAGPCITINGGPRLVAMCFLSNVPRGEFGITGMLYRTAATAVHKTEEAVGGILKSVSERLGK